jgi:sugar (pentulose or hexulose) kinase
MTSPPRKEARFLGLVFSTGECGLAAVAADGTEAYLSMPMQGATTWHGGAGFDLERVPHMVLELLTRLTKQWDLTAPGYLGQAWRQHDLVLADARGEPLIPALSWQCNTAARETEQLNAVASLRAAVGTIEPRFAVAKLPWALRQQDDLPGRVRTVMFSGDWLAGRLTGNSWTMSTSDALSNGLLRQTDKELALAALADADAALGGSLPAGLFPPLVASHGVVGEVGELTDEPWRQIGAMLRGWRVAAFLGDNHATAAGCGAAEHDGMVLSLGTSGTVNMPAPITAAPSGDILAFEYWNDRLFLLMLPQCAAWYEQFLTGLGDPATRPPFDHQRLNQLAVDGLSERVVRLGEPSSVPATPDGVAAEPWPQLRGLDVATQVASTQFSIALEMVVRAQKMLAATTTPIRRFVLTGGLLRAPLIGAVLRTGLTLLSEADDRVAADAEVLQNDRGGDLAYKTDALGAVLNAAAAGQGRPPDEVIRAWRRWIPCPANEPTLDATLRRLITAELA